MQESSTVASLAAQTLDGRLKSAIDMTALFSKRFELQDAIHRGDATAIRSHLKQLVETGGQRRPEFAADLPQQHQHRPGN